MARGNLIFRQRDVARALRAARAAGLDVAGFTVDKDGRITVQIKPARADGRENEVEAWIKKNEKHHEN